MSRSQGRDRSDVERIAQRGRHDDGAGAGYNGLGNANRPWRRGCQARCPRTPGSARFAAGGDAGRKARRDHLVARHEAPSPRHGEVRAVTASRLAEEPKLQSSGWRTPTARARSDSNCSAKRPVVSQKSRVASARCITSDRRHRKSRPTSARASGPARRRTERTPGRDRRPPAPGWPSASRAAQDRQRSSWSDHGCRDGTWRLEVRVSGDGFVHPLVQREGGRPAQHGARLDGGLLTLAPKSFGAFQCLRQF